MSEIKHITNRKLQELPPHLVEEYQPYINGYVASRGLSEMTTRKFVPQITSFLGYVRDQNLPIDIKTFLLKDTQKPAMELGSKNKALFLFRTLSTFFDYIISSLNEGSESSFMDLRHNPFKIGCLAWDPRVVGILTTGEIQQITGSELKVMPRVLVDEYRPYLNGYIAHKGYSSSSMRKFLVHFVYFLTYIRDQGLPADIRIFLLKDTHKPKLALTSKEAAQSFFSAMETFFVYVISILNDHSDPSFFDLRHNPFQIACFEGDPRETNRRSISEIKRFAHGRLQEFPQHLAEEYQDYVDGFIAHKDYTYQTAKQFLSHITRFLGYVRDHNLPVDIHTFLLRRTRKPIIEFPSKDKSIRYFTYLEQFFDYVILILHKDDDRSFFELRHNPFWVSESQGDIRRYGKKSTRTAVGLTTNARLSALPRPLVEEYQPYIDGFVVERGYADLTKANFLLHFTRFLGYVRDEILPIDIQSFLLRDTYKPALGCILSATVKNKYYGALDLFFKYVISILNKGDDPSFYELRHNPFGVLCSKEHPRFIRSEAHLNTFDNFKYLTNYDYGMREWAGFASRYVRNIARPQSFSGAVGSLNTFFRDLILLNPGQDLSIDSVLAFGSDVVIAPRSKRLVQVWTRFLSHVITWCYEDSPNRFLVLRFIDSGCRSVPYRDISKTGGVYFLWVRNYSIDLEKWRLLAVEYVEISESGGSPKRAALQNLFKAFVRHKELPRDPIKIFNAKYRKFINIDNVFAGINTNRAYSWNLLVDFFEWVRINYLSKLDDESNLTSIVENPFKKKGNNRASPSRESVYPCLPYKYISELRLRVVEGPNFNDWKYSRNIGSFNDWHVIDESLLNKEDSDCVFRLRKSRGVPYYEIWSPVRAVAVIAKLILPLRTFQVRHLDSGESDHLRFVDNRWVVNSSPLSGGKKNWQQGVFRKTGDGLNLYINTNKTADKCKSGSALGFIMPWLTDVTLDSDITYWLQKLAKWQETYFPIQRRTSWKVYAKQATKDKTELEAAKYPDACFLFRNPSSKGQPYPVTNGAVDSLWCNILRDYEQVLRGRSKSAGDYIKLMRNDGKRARFPLHSLRVSIITALFTDGEMSSELLMKVVGHCRLIMTLHYIKPVGEFLKKKLKEADGKVQNGMHTDLDNRLRDYEIDQLKETVVLDDSGLSQIDVNPNARNPIGWLHMSYGLCLAGGITHGAIDQPGCHNGGKQNSKSNYSSVPGGAFNCIRCRWFVTDPSYLNSLVALFNNIAFKLHDLKEKMFALEEVVSGMKKERYTAELEGNVYAQNGLLAAKESLLEEHTADLVNVSNDLAACWKIVQKCKERLGDESLALIGDRESFDLVIEETDSELLQLMGVCEDLEMVPNLNAADAIFRRSQILDSALVASGQGIMFASLTKEEQLLVGNKFVRKLAHQLDAENAYNGRKKLVRIIEGGDLGKKIGSVEQLLLG